MIYFKKNIWKHYAIYFYFYFSKQKTEWRKYFWDFRCLYNLLKLIQIYITLGIIFLNNFWGFEFPEIGWKLCWLKWPHANISTIFTIHSATNMSLSLYHQLLLWVFIPKAFYLDCYYFTFPVIIQVNNIYFWPYKYYVFLYRPYLPA